MDTRRSQAIDAKAGGGAIAELRNRAVLLADLLTRSPLREEIADHAGVARDRLLTRRPMNLLELRLTQKEVLHATVDGGDAGATVLQVGVHFLVEGESPIIGVDVRAPDSERAVRAANAAMTVLQAHVDAAPARGRPKGRLAVRQLEPATAGTAVVGPSSPLLAVLAALTTFCIGNAIVVAVSRGAQSMSRRQRAVVESRVVRGPGDAGPGVRSVDRAKPRAG